jgi:CsoR family transcriptional regulator, copper-sensing transcriptional repressor
MVIKKDKKIIDRLKRLEGQIGGVIKMYQSGRNCEELFQQIRAVRSGLDSLAVTLLENEVCKNVSLAKKEKASIMLQRLLKIK